MAKEMSIIKRLKSKTPRFFKIILRISLVICALTGGIIAANQTGIYFPEIIISISQQTLWIATTVSIMAKLPIEEPKAESKGEVKHD